MSGFPFFKGNMISELYIYFFENFNMDIGFCDIKQILFTNYQNWSPKKLKSQAQFKISYLHVNGNGLWTRLPRLGFTLWVLKDLPCVI